MIDAIGSTKVPILDDGGVVETATFGDCTKTMAESTNLTVTE